jgi:isopentenyl diphosphate isomerase/L-lactate dehydrogenase-like FMN-dependent dehydrogenase
VRPHLSVEVGTLALEEASEIPGVQLALPAVQAQMKEIRKAVNLGVPKVLVEAVQTGRHRAPGLPPMQSPAPSIQLLAAHDLTRKKAATGQ